MEVLLLMSRAPKHTFIRFSYSNKLLGGVLWLADVFS
jgi:hypothetical protein